VTLAMVAAHRSGIASDTNVKNATLWASLFNSSIDPVVGRRTVVQQFLQVEPDVKPNTHIFECELHHLGSHH
jgi:hypothetical protein